MAQMVAPYKPRKKQQSMQAASGVPRQIPRPVAGAVGSKSQLPRQAVRSTVMSNGGNPYKARRSRRY